MKNYKEFGQEIIGSSDIAELLLRGSKGTKSLYFGEDGTYRAYIVDTDTVIPVHYTLVDTFEKWLKIYDDDMLTQHFHADSIEVYRAGNFGTIIKLIYKEESYLNLDTNEIVAKTNLVNNYEEDIDDLIRQGLIRKL